MRKLWPMLALLSATAPAVAETPAETASTQVDKILADHIRASGGPALAAIQVEARKGTLTRGSNGPAPFETLSTGTGKWRYNQIFAWGEQLSYGYDGANAWLQDNAGVVSMEPGQLRDMQILLDVKAPLRMRELFPEMSVKGTERIGDREAITLLARSRDGTETELAFDRETGLLLRAGQITFADYRSTDGVMRPFRVRLGENLEMRLSEVSRQPAVDDAVFQRPLCTLPLREPPLYRPEKHVQVSLAAINACVGEYQTPDGSIWRVSLQGNHLMFRSPRSGFELLAQSETDYVRGYSNVEFHFAKDAAGRVTHLVLSMPNQKIEAKKVR